MLLTHLINTPLFPLCCAASIRHFSSCTARPNINHTLICDFYLMQIAPLGKALERREGSQHSAYTHPPLLSDPLGCALLFTRYHSIFLLFIISNYMT